MNDCQTQPNLADLRPGDALRGMTLAVRGLRRNPTDSNRPRLEMTLFDASQPEGRRAIVWQADETLQEAALHAQLLSIHGRLEEGPYGDQIRIDALAAVAPPDDLSPFLAAPPPGSDADWSAFREIVQSVRSKPLRQLLAILLPTERHDAWRRAYAAGRHHHAWPGGLLRHTVEVARLCSDACQALPGLRRDLLVTAALIHDIGKLDEMRHDLRPGEFTAAGNLLGHLVLGADRVQEAAARIPNFPDSLRDALRHLLLSHHERPEWGAARTPALPEALVLAQCDRMSAQVAAMQEAIAQSSGIETVRWHGGWLCAAPIDPGDTLAPRGEGETLAR